MLEKAKNFIVENRKAMYWAAGIVLAGVGAYEIKKIFFGKNKSTKKEDSKEAPKEETKKEAPKDNEGFENPK